MYESPTLIQLNTLSTDDLLMLQKSAFKEKNEKNLGALNDALSERVRSTQPAQSEQVADAPPAPVSPEQALHDAMGLQKDAVASGNQRAIEMANDALVRAHQDFMGNQTP